MLSFGRDVTDSRDGEMPGRILTVMASGSRQRETRGTYQVTMNQWVERVSRDDIVEMASNLISIPSTSGEEARVMDFVADWCQAKGIDYQIVALDPNRPNVIISIGNDDGPTIAMNGHLDTVPVSDAAAWESGPVRANPLAGRQEALSAVAPAT